MSFFGNIWDHTYGTKGLGGWLFGHGPQAVVPKDMQGLRGQQIDLLSAFLKPGAFQPGGMGANFFFGGRNPLDAILGQTPPEMQTYNTVRPVLEGMLTGTGPQFERDIANANQQGGRFGSANAILRGEALRNLFNMRNQTAQTLGALSGQAGSAQWDRTFAAQNQMLQLLSGLFGMSGQATLSLPVQDDTGNFMDLLKIGASLWPTGDGTKKS